MLRSPSSRWRALRLLAAALVFCATMPATGRAQEVLTEISPEKMTEIITSMGFEVEALPDRDDDNPAFKLQLAGYTVILFLANNNTDGQLYAGFSDRQVDAEQMNEWNQKYRFSRAYRDDDGNPVLESDVDFTGGVTDENIKAWIKLYRNVLVQYVKFLS